MAAAVTARTSWPSRPTDGYYRDDDRALPDRVLPEADLMSKLTILAVDDPEVSAAITRDLRGRYATDYRPMRGQPP